MKSLLEQVHTMDDDTQREFVQKMFEQMTLRQVIPMVKHLEDAWDVEAKPDFGDFSPPPEEVVEVEQTDFDVIVTEIGSKRIAVVKCVRLLADVSLKDSSTMLKQALPVAVLKKVSKDKAEEAKAELEANGATVEVK
jgi:large subunit ribosomal protein L7/L12